MALTRPQTTILHVAKCKLGLDDDTYRLALAKIAGVTSSTELTPEGFSAVMGFFEHCGFRPLVAEGVSYGNRPGFASHAQLELIRSLWMELHRAATLDEAALNGWLLKWFKLSSLRFLKAENAPKVITALKMWKRRAA